jgi:hypothetical protein
MGETMTVGDWLIYGGFVIALAYALWLREAARA